MFINLKELKDNIGGQIKLILKKNNGSVNKEYTDANGQRKSFTVFQYIVDKGGQNFELEASQALARKLNDLNFEDAFMLSFEVFEKDGQQRNYWKVEPVEKTQNEFTNYVANQQAEQKVDKVVSNKVVEKSLLVNNGARFGMVFNNTFKLYTDPNVGNCSWSTDQFANEFLRVMRMVEACENIEVTPVKKPEQKIVKETFTSEPKFVNIKESQPVQIDEDDLPF
jgi:hypothetical protein